MNIWHCVSKERIKPDNFLTCIEIPKACKCKYELDKETGYLRLDRVLSTSTAYPHNYGFIPRTLSADGDPLDVLVLCSEIINPLSLIDCKAIGVIMMNDGGFSDEKIIAVGINDPFYNEFKEINELPDHILQEIIHFFKVYKQLENKITSIESMGGADKAREIIVECIERYNENFSNYR